MIPPNVWIVFLIGLVPLAVGALYYSPALLHNAWMRAAGMTEEKIANANMTKIFGLSYVYGVLIALLLSMIVIHQFALSGMFGMLSDQWMVEGSSLMTQLDALDAEFEAYSRHRHFGHGALHGGFFALAFVAPIICINALFERFGWRYMAIHSGYWFICLTLMGGLLAQFLKLPL